MISSSQLRNFPIQHKPLCNLLLGLAWILALAVLPDASAQVYKGRTDASAQVSKPQTAPQMTFSRTSSVNYPACTINPSTIDAGRRAAVRLGVTYPTQVDSNNISFYAVRMQSNGSPQNLATLAASSQGNQTVVSGTLQFQEPAPGVIALQVWATTSKTGGREVLVSQACSLTVRAPSTGQGSYGGNTNNGQNSAGDHNNGGDTRNGHGNSASQWGELAGGIIGGLIKSRHKDNNSNNNAPGNTIAGDNQVSNNTQPPPQPTPAPARPTPVPMSPLSARGLTLRYPQGWNFHNEILNLGGPVNLRNFDRYLSGGVLPSGGAEIDITTVPFDGQGDLRSIAQEDLGAANARDYRVDDRPALLLNYTDDFAAGFGYDNRAVYVAVGDTVYKFFLSYRNGDPGARNFVRDFQQVLASAHFTRN